MVGRRERGRAIRDYIVAHVSSHADNIGQVCAAYFGISRQAVNRHLRRLLTDGVLTAQGATRNRRYSLAILRQVNVFLRLADRIDEDTVWRTEIAPLLSDLPQNVREIWQYGFTEMLNNAIDHSSGTRAVVEFSCTAIGTRINLWDDGEGIFRKITRELRLDDERHAVLELAKGKLTTDPENHTGEGIFFTSRLFDRFNILSHEVFFSHDSTTQEDWILESGSTSHSTFVVLELRNDTEKVLRQVFDEHTADGDYGFSKTVVPVSLVRYGDEALISRSQAKRLLTRFDRFKAVLLDFNGVDQIGQGFADEVFRVFARAHSNVDLVPINANEQVDAMIRHARNTA